MGNNVVGGSDTVKKYILKSARNEIIYKIDYQKELTPEQFEAVNTNSGAFLVIAGAGSGKTRTLIYRVAKLIEDGIDPKNILLLTFTRKAAQEMLSRCELLLDERAKQVAGGTFHSFASMILRKYSSMLELKNNFTIMDRSDAEDVINHVRTFVVQKKDKRFPRKKTLLDIYSKAINKSEPLETVVQNYFGQFEYCLDEILEICKRYAAYKRENSLLDYDDLLLYLKTLLISNEEVRKKISNQYKYILVDEYQDTNLLQAQIVKLLASEHNNIFAVGDDSQSIYSFRGANFKNIMKFTEIFENARVLKLEENFRSTQPILDFTNNVIQNAKEKYSKKLYTRRAKGAKPAVIACPTIQNEAEFIAQRTLELIEEGYSLNDIAVLARSARLTYSLEIELSKRNIPYRKFGGFKFIETAHVKDVIAYLKLTLNPADVICWNRILLLIKGVGATTVNKLLPALTTNAQLPAITKSTDEIEKLLKTIEYARTNFNNVSGIVNYFIEFYKPYLIGKYDDYTKREKDLEHFSILSAQYKKLEDFLTDLALEPPDSSVDDVKEGAVADEFLTLSTIHSAKGLEWAAVFIMGVLEGRFPSVYSYNNEEELEEERRLMYVASTRAKDLLYMTYPIDMFDYATSTVLSKPSRFIAEAQGEILETWELGFTD